MTKHGRDISSSLKIGSRGSRLALAQAAAVADRVQELFPERTVEVLVVQTEGDLDKISPLTEIGGRGVFTSALEAALTRGEIDAAVHSAKDLPTSLHPAAPVVAFLDRVDPCDVLVSRKGLEFEYLPANAVIGTSSRRREVQIGKLWPDSRAVNIRGNIDTRLRKLDRGDFDALLLAAAGLLRLGWEQRISQHFSVDEMVPAPGQGALAVQAKRESAAEELMSALDDPCVAIPVAAERAFLAALGAGCAVPVGAYAAHHTNQYRMRTMLATADGARMVEAEDDLDPGSECEHAAEIGRRLQTALGWEPNPSHWVGWDDTYPTLHGARAVVTRPRTQAGPLLTALADRGAEPIAFPTIRIENLADTTALDTALMDAANGKFSWLVFTSVNAVDVVGARLHAIGRDAAILAKVAVAVVGRSTAAAAKGLGLNVIGPPAEATSTALVEALRGSVRLGDRVLYPASAVGREEFPAAMRALGADLVVIPVYTTIAEPDVDGATLARIRTGDFDFVTFSSPSAVQRFVELIDGKGDVARRSRAVCAGPVTATAAIKAGFDVVAIAIDPGPDGMADAAAAYWDKRGSQVGRQESSASASRGRSVG